jgi:hypothetical protein
MYLYRLGSKEDDGIKINDKQNHEVDNEAEVDEVSKEGSSSGSSSSSEGKNVPHNKQVGKYLLHEKIFIMISSVH